MGTVLGSDHAGETLCYDPPANTEFCPNDYAIQGQMAAFLERALG